MLIFLIALTIYVATLIFLNAKIKPDNKELPQNLEMARKAVSIPGKFMMSFLLAMVLGCIYLAVEYILYWLSGAKHPFFE